MARYDTENCLRATHAIVYCSVDAFIPLRGKISPGFGEFCAELREANIPCVWLSGRSRAQLDDPLRKLDHQEPFVAEGGSGVYIPVDYFHLRGEKSERRGRFLCIPVAQPQPAAAVALESLSHDTGVEAVALRSLSPRELAQNSGLPQREAELARQRDFDELFFFAGATDSDIERFREEATRRKLQLRPRGVLWSLAAGASVAQCVREITKLYDRALHGHAPSIAIAPADEAADAIGACDRQFILGASPVTEGTSPEGVPAVSTGKNSRAKWISLSPEEDWEELAKQIAAIR
jgi:predicted mannosyl-3-phosphoglycerate phosphatase (HAD superfamily)